MAEKKSRISKLFDKYLARMDSLKKEGNASILFDELSRGKNAYMRLDRLGTSSFDMTWINAIEEVLFDLGDIVKNPREVTKSEAVLVPVELARKTNSESVRHLASHTQYIKTVDEEGNVVPNKVITIANEEDIHTYENRFIATLIRRLVLFIEKRYEFIKNVVSLKDEQILYFKNKSVVNGADVEIETKIKILADSDNSMADISHKFISRVKDIREYVLYYYSSPFMKKMKVDHDVRNPIILTNILRKNPKYRRCYELYRFIEKYQQLGVSYKVDETVSILNQEEINELNTVAFTNYLALKDKDRSKNQKVNSKTYKPKILSSIDDEKFIYDDLLRGPFTFVRVDEPYQAYLDSKLKADLPIHPTKVEREYYRDEYMAKRENREDKDQLERLKRRKTKEALDYEKRVQEIIAERQREEELRLLREEEERRLEEERRIDAIRRQIVAAARGEEIPDEDLTEHPVEESQAKNDNKAQESEEQRVNDYNLYEPVEEASEDDIHVNEAKAKRPEMDPKINAYIDSLFAKIDDDKDLIKKGKRKPLDLSQIKDDLLNEEEVQEIFTDQPKSNRPKVDQDAIDYVNSLFDEENNKENTEEKPNEEEIEDDDEVIQIFDSNPKSKKKKLGLDIDQYVDKLFTNDDSFKIIVDASKEESLIFSEKKKDKEVPVADPDVVKYIDSLFEDEENNEKPTTDENEGEEVIKIHSDEPKKKKKHIIEPGVKEYVDQLFDKVNEVVEDDSLEESIIYSVAPKKKLPKVDEEVNKFIDHLFDEQEKTVVLDDDDEEINIHSERPKDNRPEVNPEIVEYVDSLFEDDEGPDHDDEETNNVKESSEDTRKDEESNEDNAGKFIVKTPKGYYCKDGKFSNNKKDAYVFNSYKKAKKIKNKYGGKVVKL